MTSPTARPSAPQLTRAQRRTFEELFGIGHDRPTTPPGLPEKLAERIEAGTAAALNRWTESSLFMTKSAVSTTLNCEGMLIAQREAPPSEDMYPAVAVGNIAHHAIQIASTHPGAPVLKYVRWAIGAALEDDLAFRRLWTGASPARQSDWQQQMVARTTAFLDTFPPLADSWTPQFELSLRAKVGRLTLSARPDLVLGRPKPNGRQTLLLVDFKTGGLHDGHPLEAAFYALVATLRYGVAPYRSCVLSLASGEWTDPDVHGRLLEDTADTVIDAVNRHVDVLAAARPAQLTPGVWCRFCPARDTCDEAQVG